MEKILSNCYRLPWREDNNPNGWIEPTTFCQLKCPGCYRGVDKKTHRAEHEDLQKMKSHVDWLISNRNIHTLSIAGGDPMVYPFLEELISYAAHKNLRTMVYTNGVDLDEARLFKLKSAGVTQIVIHIDIYQGRKNCATEEQADALREEFCNLFRKVKGVNLGFIQPLSRETLADISKSNAFFVRNRDVINLVVYTLYREIG
ncbi:MAG: radical SAM protein, partial [Bacteroidales bacterium]|nr:radical SAM protein [Bacteroidales bacterium]MBN2821365.1 radical SAM protein [Bacteroidales bacterium]